MNTKSFNHAAHGLPVVLDCLDESDSADIRDGLLCAARALADLIASEVERRADAEVASGSEV